MTGDVVPPGAVRAVAAFSTGRVKIHPQHAHGSRLPSLAWILLSPTWGDWRSIHVFVIEHDQGLVLFDAGQDLASLTDPDYYPASPLMRLIYRRLARFEMGAHQTVSAQRRRGRVSTERTMMTLATNGRHAMCPACGSSEALEGTCALDPRTRGRGQADAGTFNAVPDRAGRKVEP